MVATAPPQLLHQIGNDRERSREPRRDWLVPSAYLLAITLAEFLTAVVNPRLGVPLHAIILLGLLLHGALTSSERDRGLLWSLATAPLIRIVSLSLPLLGLPIVSWYALISVPVFGATIATMRVLGFSRREVGLVLRPRHLPLALLLLVLGLALGIVEYLILRPAPLARGLSLAEALVPALVLAISTGFEEELLFRGVLQRAATTALGPVSGSLYITTLFAVLHIGYLSVVDLVFVFAVGLFFALVSYRSGSILPATFAHAGVNLGMFIVWPYLLPRLLGGA
jgi:uncharacterized protein